MAYLKSVKQIDTNIEEFIASGRKVHKTCKYLIKHSSKNLLGPLKECIWKGGFKSSKYRNANGNLAYKFALKIGYNSVLSPWKHETLMRSEFQILHEGQEYLVLFHTHSDLIEKTYLDFIKAEQNLRHLIGRPLERNDPIGQFGEFLYCKLFGCYSPGALNLPGFDVIDPISDEKIQIKVARKAKTNSAGIAVKLSSIKIFDRLVIFWLSDDRKIGDFYELSRTEVMQIVKSKRLRKMDSIDIKKSDLNERMINSSRKKLLSALINHNLTGLLDSKWET
jgi:hypothetical protein